MFSKRLFIVVFFRILLILFTSFAFVSVMDWLQKEYYLSLVAIGMLIIYQVYLLTRYLNRTNRKLALFFNSVRNEDSVLRYSHDHRDKIFDALGASLDEINTTIGEMRRQKVQQNLFLNNLVEQIGVGLISYSGDGAIMIFNTTAKELLQMNRPENINDLSEPYPDLYLRVMELQPNQQQLVKVTTKQSILFLSLKLKIFVFEKETVNLLSLQNIRAELEHRELDSWQKLIRVLTHEISNSISPINSLANTTKKYFVEKGTGSVIGKDEITDTLLQKTVGNLDTIETTGKGLIEFVSIYKSLTALPQPVFEKFRIAPFFDRLRTLLSGEAIFNGIALEFTCTPGDLELTADTVLLQKVLVNLVNNASQALEGIPDGRIQVSAFRSMDEGVVMEVRDNGCGVPPEIIDDIFIPFFTSKKGGSGIGLSLSRQIMSLHRGVITVSSIPGKETVFSLLF